MCKKRWFELGGSGEEESVPPKCFAGFGVVGTSI